MAEELTREQELNKLANLEREAERLRKKLGGESNGEGGPSDRVQRQKDDAALFDSLSRSGGLTELFVKDPDTFYRLQAAKRGIGEADLVGRNKIGQVP